jgi:hypothetical protein
MSSSPSKVAESGHAVLAYDTRNLGDDIQSLAALQYLPAGARPVNRDLLSQVESSTPLKLIMNGWFMGRPSWPPADCIRPLFTSFHIGTCAYPEYGGSDPRGWLLADESIDYLRRHGPVGCRDLETLALLRERSVPSFFSGCLTLTLRPPAGFFERREILLVDADLDEQWVIPAMPLERRQDVHCLTHATARGFEPQARMREAESLLFRYARAHLVITSRLHCLLPCLAYGTPVFFTGPLDEHGRLQGYERFFRMLALENGRVQALVDWESPGPNPGGHEPVAEALRRSVADFLASAIPEE